MPILWNAYGMMRNNLTFSVLLVLFCPWPFVTIFFIGLCGFAFNEWDEELEGSDLEEWIETFLALYEVGDGRLENALHDQDKFRRGELKWGQWPSQIAEVKEGVEWLKSSPKIKEFEPYVEPWLDMATEDYEYVMDIIDATIDEYYTTNPLQIEENDLMIESLSYWTNELLRPNYAEAAKEFAYGPKVQAKEILLNSFQKKCFYKKAFHEHVFSWLDALPFKAVGKYQSFPPYSIEENVLLRNLLKAEDKNIIDLQKPNPNFFNISQYRSKKSKKYKKL